MCNSAKSKNQEAEAEHRSVIFDYDSPSQHSWNKSASGIISSHESRQFCAFGGGEPMNGNSRSLSCYTHCSTTMGEMLWQPPFMTQHWPASRILSTDCCCSSGVSRKLRPSSTTDSHLAVSNSTKHVFKIMWYVGLSIIITTITIHFRLAARNYA